MWLLMFIDNGNWNLNCFEWLVFLNHGHWNLYILELCKMRAGSNISISHLSLNLIWVSTLSLKISSLKLTEYFESETWSCTILAFEFRNYGSFSDPCNCLLKMRSPPCFLPPLMRLWAALLTYVISFCGWNSKAFYISDVCCPFSVSLCSCDLELPSRNTWQLLPGFIALTFQPGWKFALTPTESAS